MSLVDSIAFNNHIIWQPPNILVWVTWHDITITMLCSDQRVYSVHHFLALHAVPYPIHIVAWTESRPQSPLRQKLESLSSTHLQSKLSVIHCYHSLPTYLTVQPLFMYLTPLSFKREYSNPYLYPGNTELCKKLTLCRYGPSCEVYC